MADRYWVGGSGSWNDTSTANWSATTGGASGASAPTTADNVFFDANSGSGVVDVYATARAQNITINTTTLALTLQDNVTPQIETRTTSFIAGTINLNNFALTLGLLRADNNNARAINFGTGKIVIKGTSGTVFSLVFGALLTLTGSKRVELDQATGVGTRTVFGTYIAQGGTADNTPNIYVLNGTDIVSISSAAAGYNTLDFTGFSGTLAGTGSAKTVFADFILSSTMTASSFASGFIFAGAAGPYILDPKGITIGGTMTFNGVGGTWSLASNLVLSGAMTLTNGTLNAGTKNVSVGTFALGAGTKTLTLGSGAWTVTGANWNANTNVANFTVSTSTATISMTSSSAKTFAGGDKVWPTLNQGGTGALTIQQSNTFANITNTVQPATITLTSGTTQTVTDFDVSGTAGNLITLNASTPGSRATLTDSGGINSVSYVDIKDIAATGYGEWQAYTSNGNVDSGNNVGWVFAEPPPLTASEYQISLKSFTERRSF